MSWTKDSLRRAFREYLERIPVQSDLARAIGASAQNITDWKESGAIPGWAMLNLLSFDRRAREFFLMRESLVMESPEDYGTARRNRLIRMLKELARDAPDDIIDALFKLVEVFRKMPREEDGQ